MVRILSVVVLSLWSCALVAAEVDGVVQDRAGAPRAGIVVRLQPPGIDAVTDDHGHFHFDDVAPGAYTLVAVGHDAEPISLDVAEGAVARVALTVTEATEGHVTVTATPYAGRSPLELARAAQVLGGAELARRAAGTLGETVAGQPGVTATGFGQGASRPVIRGLGDDRVRVLRSGIGTFDVSAVSDDHGVALEPLLLDQVEILRGPATLLYGSGAIGGVVNAIDSRIPERALAHGVESRVEARTASGNGERSLVARFDGSPCAGLAWHADAYRRDLGDYGIAGGAELHNSASRNAGGAVGASWVFDRGFIGASLSVLDNAYGVPGSHGHGHGVAEDDHDHDVRIAQRQTRLDVAGSLRAPWPGFELARFRFGIGDYEHQELEGHAVGTTFTNDAWEGRAEFTHTPVGGWLGALGAQFSHRDFAAVGAEAFTPPVTTDEGGAFWVGERAFGVARVEAGARIGRVEHESTNAPARGFTLYSVSLGVAVPVAGEVDVALNAGLYARAPSAESLYSQGPHLASLTYELGDPALRRERSRAVEAIVRDTRGRLRWSATAYSNRFDDFIHQHATGATDAATGLRVMQYRQRDARFHGFEVEAETTVADGAAGRVDVRAFADAVRARFADGTAVPRIPPARVGASVALSQAAWSTRLEWQRVASQDRVAATEAATPGHTLLALDVDYRAYTGATEWFVFIRGTNLLDEDAYRHVSFLKEDAPLPGRSWQLGLRAEF